MSCFRELTPLSPKTCAPRPHLSEDLESRWTAVHSCIPARVLLCTLLSFQGLTGERGEGERGRGGSFVVFGRMQYLLLVFTNVFSSSAT